MMDNGYLLVIHCEDLVSDLSDLVGLIMATATAGEAELCAIAQPGSLIELDA